MQLGWYALRRRLKLVVVVSAVVALAGVLSAVALARAGDRGLAHKTGSGCPAALSAALGDTGGVEAAARAFGSHQSPQRFVVGLLSMSSYSLGTDNVWRNIAREKCGARVESRSWVAFYFTHGGAKSPDLSEGVVYFAKTAGGWKAWYVYR